LVSSIKADEEHWVTPLRLETPGTPEHDVGGQEANKPWIYPALKVRKFHESRGMGGLARAAEHHSSCAVTVSDIELSHQSFEMTKKLFSVVPSMSFIAVAGCVNMTVDLPGEMMR
jgi:hypothetical protein